MTTLPLEFLDSPAMRVVAAVERAAHLARRIRQETVVAASKPDRTPLTIADLAVQVVISDALERDFAEDALLAEEDGAILHTAAGQALAAPLLHYLQPSMPGLTLAELTRLLNRGTRTPAERTWVLDLAGRRLDFGAGARLVHNEGILVSNGVLHTPALLALRSARLRER